MYLGSDCLIKRQLIEITLKKHKYYLCLAGITVKVTPSVDVIKGETARLPCSYTTTDSSALTVVNWFIENQGSRKRVAFRSSTDSGVDKDTPLAGRVIIESDMTLVISQTNVEDQRSFYCQASGPVGVKEEETKLKVFFAPEKPVVSGHDQTILIQGSDSSSQVGTCTSNNGHPQPRIIWYKDAVPLPEVTDTKEKTYMVPRVVRESSGLYTVSSSLYVQLTKADAKSVFHCTVEYTMPNGMVKKESSDNFSLTLHYAAEKAMFTLLNSGSIKEGDDVQLKCETDGNPQPKFEMTSEGKPLENINGLLVLKSVNRSNSGTYNCEALDFDALDPSALTKSVTINVHYLDPVSIAPAGPLTVKKGTAVEVQCQTKSPDQYTLVWTKDNKELSKTGVLSLETVTLASAGEYVCTASVPSVPGLQKTANITIRVEGAPEIEAPKKAEVQKEGDPVNFECSALGYPAPQFTWKPSGKESVRVEGHKTISKISLPATGSVLKDGVICEASNSHGSDSKKFQVEIKTGSFFNVIFETQQGGSSGVVIAVVVCVLLLLLLVASLYCLSKKGKLPCSKKRKMEVSGDGNNANIVMTETGEKEKQNEGSGLLNKQQV
ncbi:basal cell adhesion molecule isoform X1 [Astyanax mexicanus]|uniref:Basal cell adhesion molecule isoform X1 n=1 Tax=Astyanax mexicanus TaxID=7994 RepID=A0A8T2M1I2_ASTMX|nr:basal cell adhesion molecule isoform X1 [Astyanax mexicanus]